MIYAQGNSVVLSASGSVSSKPARILGVGIKAGSDTASVKLLDGGSGGTQKTITFTVEANSCNHWSFPNGIQCSTSLYATITGTSPEVCIEYEN